MRKVAMLVLAVALAGCAARTDRPVLAVGATVPTELSTAYPALRDAWVALDANALRPYYTDNAVIVTSTDRFTGWNDIHSRWLTPNLGNVSNFRTSDVQFRWEGSDIIETGRYSFRTNADGRAQNVRGVFANRWQRQPDGSWRVVSATIQ